MGWLYLQIRFTIRRDLWIWFTDGQNLLLSTGLTTALETYKNKNGINEAGVHIEPVDIDSELYKLKQ
jgi:hypothetical protein